MKSSMHGDNASTYQAGKPGFNKANEVRWHDLDARALANISEFTDAMLTAIVRIDEFAKFNHSGYGSLAHLAEEYWPSRPIKGSTRVIEDFDATVKAAEIGLTKRLVSAISAISELPDLLLQTNFERALKARFFARRGSDPWFQLTSWNNCKGPIVRMRSFSPCRTRRRH